MGELYNPFPKLPKNIRQIGDTDQVVRLYVEDYVNTYLKRLYPAGNQTLRVGLLLGNTENYDGTPYIFIDGAIEMEDVEVSGEKVEFSENAWKKAYRGIEESFPKRTVQGWFICGTPSSQLSPLNYWKLHNQYFNGKNKLMYLNHGLEGEEAVYVTSEDGFYRLKGHCIYYERNQMMQDYMVTRKDVRRVESGSHEKVIKDFRQRMTVRKEQADAGRHMSGILGTACGVLTVAVLAGGVVLVNNYHKMRQMETVLTSVVPAGTANWSDYLDKLNQEPDFVIEERPGNVFPTDESRETGESYAAETMEATEAGTNSKSSEVSEVQEIRRQPACWGNPLLQASQTIQIQLLQQESPALTGPRPLQRPEPWRKQFHPPVLKLRPRHVSVWEKRKDRATHPVREKSRWTTPPRPRTAIGSMKSVTVRRYMGSAGKSTEI